MTGFAQRFIEQGITNISKAQTLLDYAPTQRISEGLALAMPWYVGQRPAPNMSL